MEQKFCQSCGMPLTDDNKGINANGDYVVSGPQTSRIGDGLLINE